MVERKKSHGVEFKTLEKVVGFQIDQTDEVKDILERHSKGDFFVKMDFLCKHSAFNSVQLISMHRIAKEAVHIRHKISDTVMDTSQKDTQEGIRVVIRGNATLSVSQNQEVLGHPAKS